MVFPSTSLSSVPSVNTFPETAVFWLVAILSSTAIGASFTAVMLIFIVPISEPPFASVAE